MRHIDYRTGRSFPYVKDHPDSKWVNRTLLVILIIFVLVGVYQSGYAVGHRDGLLEGLNIQATEQEIDKERNGVEESRFTVNQGDRDGKCRKESSRRSNTYCCRES